MVLGVTVAGGAAVTSWLWGYNRENFKFDREMRQKNEFKILEFRNVQSQLWREDIRDIISLTEKKMDSYLIVSVLQLDACVGLFTEGRLEPGTPPWLLHLYMMTLGGAFMYLLMSVWFAMHASVVAQCSSVRLLTQFVRLPVPTWQEIEHMRTYASSYEKMHPAHWMRVPFMKSMAPTGEGKASLPPSGMVGGQPSGASRASCSTPASAPACGGRGAEDPACAPEAGAETGRGGDESLHADPWGLEAHGERRDIYELSEQDPALRRHIQLARKAAAQYQCFDAFTRVSMTFGTNQFVCAIAYYSLGYVAVQDGSPWVALATCTTMASIAMAMVDMDFSLARCDRWTLKGLIVISIATAACCTFFFVMKGARSELILTSVLPVAYMSNCFWLFRALRCAGIAEQPNGAMLPTRFRAVLYLDVFGWLNKDRKKEQGEQGGYCGAGETPSAAAASASASCSRQKLVLPSARTRPLDEPASAGTKYCHECGCAKAHCICSWHEDNWTGQAATEPRGPAGQIHHVPQEAFAPDTYCPPEAAALEDDADVVTGHDRMHSGRLASQVFVLATWMLIALWFFGTLLPLSLFHRSLTQPVVADVFVEDLEDKAFGDVSTEGMHAVIGTDSSGLPELVPSVQDPNSLPPLPGSPDRIQVAWPTHSSFVPRAMSSDFEGNRLVVADDFNIYMGEMHDKVPLIIQDASLVGAQIPSRTALRGRGLQEQAASRQLLALSLTRGTLCPGLVGQSLKDISVLCAAGTGCRLHALVSRGERLVECGVSLPWQGGQAEAPMNDFAAPQDYSWNIAQDWLHAEKGETIDSIALNDACLRDQWANATHAFWPQRPGCMVVGTSEGRIVQMREALADESKLLPLRILHQRPHPASRGSMSFPNGRYLLSLWAKFSSLTAFDAVQGSIVKEWRLPTHIRWLMLSGAGDNIYVIGVRDGGHVELYHFPMPSELLKEPRYDRRTLARQ